MKHLILLLILLIPLPAHAGPAAMKLLSVMGEQCPPSPTPGQFTINGVASVDGGNGSTDDTGTERICTNAGNITVPAQCNNTQNTETYVYLYVDGTPTTLSCIGVTNGSTTLTKAVLQGAHYVRVYATSYGGIASYSAGPFTKP